jgi:hypothetical protein
MSESTRSYDHSPDQKFSYWNTHNTMEMGTVLHGFSKLKPIPIPMHTCDTLLWVYLYLCHALPLIRFGLKTEYFSAIIDVVEGVFCLKTFTLCP